MKFDLQGLQSTAPRQYPYLVKSFGEDSLSDLERQLLHSLCNMGWERVMRSLEKLHERRDLPAWLEEGFAELFQ